MHLYPISLFTYWWWTHIVTNVLGISQACCWEECCVSNITSGNNIGSGGVGWDRPSGKDQPQPSPTPPTQRRLAKSFSVTPSAVTKGTIQTIPSLANIHMTHMTFVHNLHF